MTSHSRQVYNIRSRGCIMAGGLGSGLLLLLLVASQQQQQQQVEAASARLNGHHVTKLSNKYFLNEFCDLKSKTMRSPKKYKPNQDTHSLVLSPRNTLSSLQVVPHKQSASRPAFGSSISLGSSGANGTLNERFKQLNCSIIVEGPKSHGLLVIFNSIGLPKNLTKLDITLNHGSPHAKLVPLDSDSKSSLYLLTEQNSSSIAINLQTFQPIDWSHVSFDILFTLYKKANGSTGCPNKNWFDCGDNICIPASSVCDGNRNCPNGSDELTFYLCYSPLFWSVALSAGLALSIIISILVVMFIVKKRRINRLGGGQLSLSDNALTSEGDLMGNDNNSSKLDLTHVEGRHSTSGGPRTNNSYLASNLYLSGFENPVWQNGTLSKQAAAGTHTK